MESNGCHDLKFPCQLKLQGGGTRASMLCPPSCSSKNLFADNSIGSVEHLDMVSGATLRRRDKLLRYSWATHDADPCNGNVWVGLPAGENLYGRRKCSQTYPGNPIQLFLFFSPARFQTGTKFSC